jgi:hypothetical protein
MSMWPVVLAIVVLLMSRTMVGLYFDGSYACPTCGATDEERHADECPWNAERWIAVNRRGPPGLFVPTVRGVNSQ